MSREDLSDNILAPRTVEQGAVPPAVETPEAQSPPAAPAPARSKSPRVWTVFAALGLAAVAQVASVVVLIAVAARLYGVDELRRNLLGSLEAALGTLEGPAATTLAGQLSMAGVAICAALLSPRAWRQRLRWLPSRFTGLGILISVIGMLAVAEALSSVANFDFVPPSPALEQIQSWIQALDVRGRLVALLLIGVLPGIAEELLFRGYVQTRLSQRWGRAAGVVCTACLFGAMHFDPVHSFLAFFMGLYLGYLAERGGSIRPSMICHAANNSLSVLSSWFDWERDWSAHNVAILGGSLAVAGLAIGILQSRLVVARDAAVPSGTPA